MDTELLKNRPKTNPALKRRLAKLWNDMDQDMVVKQADKMEKRIKSIISSRGEWTGTSSRPRGVVTGAEQRYAHT
jgi:hypothetical protein